MKIVVESSGLTWDLVTRLTAYDINLRRFVRNDYLDACMRLSYIRNHDTYYRSIRVLMSTFDRFSVVPWHYAEVSTHLDVKNPK